MAIVKTECNCGEKITVRSGPDAKMQGRRDGKQVLYTSDERSIGPEYDIFRCRNCMEPIGDSCQAAAYG